MRMLRCRRPPAVAAARRPARAPDATWYNLAGSPALGLDLLARRERRSACSEGVVGIGYDMVACAQQCVINGRGQLAVLLYSADYGRLTWGDRRLATPLISQTPSL